jgi:Di-haem cytochrome c peroxidase
MTGRGGRVRAFAVVALVLFAAARSAAAFPVNGHQTILPNGSELGEDVIDQPTEIFHSEAIGGRKSYLDKLGDMAFSSPLILGGPARKAGINCGTCHVNGAGNAKFYIPGMSTRPGNFDTTGPFFNPPADNGVLDPVTIPSLRGVRYLAPYGHDGRFAALRDFVRNVIVNEFAGPEPSPTVLDAIVIYLQDIDFLPNPLLGPAGRLTANASAPARRGEALFTKPFPRDPSLSCASCHVPSGAFVDHRLHDVGSGGLFKTPTLLNADFNAPYFHDGRYQSFDQVVVHFDRTFALHLTHRDQQDLVAYLKAVGNGADPITPDGVDAQMIEIDDFSSLLATAIPAHDKAVIALTAETVGPELREFSEHYPRRMDRTVSGGLEKRAAARAALEGLVLSLRKIEMAAAGDDFAAAATEYANYDQRLAQIVPTLKAAEPWSLYNPVVHDAHYAALRQMIETARKSSP